MAINKEIDLRFVVGYTPLEFRDTLHMLAEGKVDPRPLITGEVGLDGVDARLRRARRSRSATRRSSSTRAASSAPPGTIVTWGRGTSHVVRTGSTAPLPGLAGTLLSVRSASAVIVRLGFTPGLAGIAAPSLTSMRS